MPSESMNFNLSASQKQAQSTLAQRRSLHVSHFDALHNAVSDLARIDDFTLEELGVGFFSDVYKATHKQTGQVLVLKKNKPTNTKLNILREIQLMNRLSHPNILKFKGVCVDEGQLHGLTEFINGGDLTQLLTNKKISLSWRQRISLALDVARGLRYLHSVGIFHRDLSSNNCLVRVSTDKNGNKIYAGVVADLGLAEKIPTSVKDEERLSVVGTAYIIAPEVLHGKRYNEKADIFSFGLILCQLIARVSFDPEELPRSKDFGLARDLFVSMISSSVGSDLPSDHRRNVRSSPPPDSLLQLAFDCCEIEPALRPSFVDVVSKLESILESETKRQKFLSYRGIYETDINQLRPHKPAKLRPKLSSPKVSRTNSDISRELLQHARAVACSTSYNIPEERDPFENPFDALESFSPDRYKLIDEPSLALFELTFDLATSESLKTSCNQNDKLKKERRPKSFFLGQHHHHIEKGDNDFLPSSFSLQTTVDGLHSPERTNIPNSPRSSCSEEILSQCNDCSLERAKRRAMFLSPLCTHMASWWCNHCRDPGEDLPGQRQAMAAVMAVLSRGTMGVRRSISVPNLSISVPLFNYVDAETENRILHTLDVSHKTTDPPCASNRDCYVETSIVDQNQNDAIPRNLLLDPIDESSVPDEPPMSPSVAMSVKTGEISRQHRRNKRLSPEESIIVGPTSNTYNRDSGYDDSIVDGHSSYRDRHVSWEIPEETASFSFPHCDVQPTKT